MAQTKILLSSLQGKKTSQVPFWFMRQAGRYLPEYRELRGSTKGFLNLVFDSKKAAEVTLQPIRRFGMDGAILFSDILVVPYALGVDVRFAEGEGPIVEVVDTLKRIEKLDTKKVKQRVAPVLETIRLVKKQLPKETTLLGFAGSPWTVACYMLQGRSGKEFAGARQFAYGEPKLMGKLIDKLVTATIEYLDLQIQAGAEAVQLFDSWAGLLTPDQFAQWVLAPTKKITAALKKRHPHVPIIGFARGAGQHIRQYATTGIQCIGVDMQTEMKMAIASVGKKQAVQGNLDPLLVASDKKAALAQTKKILESFGNHPAIFNLGHGFIPQTPVENVKAISDFVKAWRR